MPGGQVRDACWSKGVIFHISSQAKELLLKLVQLANWQGLIFLDTMTVAIQLDWLKESLVTQMARNHECVKYSEITNSYFIDILVK